MNWLRKYTANLVKFQFVNFLSLTIFDSSKQKQRVFQGKVFFQASFEIHAYLGAAAVRAAGV